MYKGIRAAVAGSINMDLILKTGRMPLAGESLTGTDYTFSAGGKGANQAIGLARLGAATKLIGKVADDANGHKLLENLQRNGVDVSAVATDGTQTGLAAILLETGGANRILVYPGANSEIDPLEAERQITDDLQLLLVQFETSEDVVVRCVHKAVERHIITVVDCGPAKAFPLEMMQGVTILTPNETETQALCGIFPSDETTVREASELLMSRSHAKYVVLKLGAKGCSVWDGSALTLLPAYKSTVVDTTAAGDCFTAAMALEFVRSGDILHACDVGNKAGSISVTRLGAASSMPTAAELTSF